MEADYTLEIGGDTKGIKQIIITDFGHAQSIAHEIMTSVKRYKGEDEISIVWDDSESK